MTSDELRALADKAIEIVRRAVFIPDIREGEDLIVSEEVSIALTTLENLAQLCAELGEELDRIWQRRESWYDAMHDDEAGLPSDEAEAAWEIASAALAKMAELEAR